MSRADAKKDLNALRAGLRTLELDRTRGLDQYEAEQKVLRLLRNETMRLDETTGALREHLASVTSELEHKAVKCVEVRDAIDRVCQDSDALIRERIEAMVAKRLDTEIEECLAKEPYLFDATKLNSVRDSREVLIHDGVSGANLSFRLVVQRSDTFGDVLAQVLGMLGLREDTDMNTTFIITDAGGAMWPRTIQALAALESLGGCPELWLNKRAKLPYHELETFVPQSAVFLAPPVVGEKELDARARRDANRAFDPLDALVEQDKVLKNRAAVIRDFGVYMCFVVLYSVLLGVRSDTLDTYALHRAIRTQLSLPFGEDSRTTLVDISTEREMWDWMHGPLRAFVYTTRFWPAPAQRPTPPELGAGPLLVGPVRVLQNRVRPDLCTIDTRVTGVRDLAGEECYPGYSTRTRELVTFRRGRPTPNVPGFAPTPGQSSMKLWGFVGRYDDEGFALDLDPRTVNLTEWHRRLTELESRTWIDRQTRVVIVNLNIVDGTVGIVAAPKVFFEFSPSGRILARLRIESFNPSAYGTLGEKLEGFAEGVLALCMLYFMSIIWQYVGIEVQDRRPRTLREQVQASLSALFSNVWITLDFIAAITFLASVSLRLSFFFSAARRGLRLDSATYVELHGLAFQSGLIFQVEAFGFIAVLLKGFKFFHLESHLTLGWRLLVALFSSLALSIVGFAVLGFQLYGAELEGFSEFIKAVNTLIAMTRGLMDYTAMSDAQPVFNPVFVTTYTLWVTFILLNAFLAVVLLNFTDAARAQRKKSKPRWVDFLEYILPGIRLHILQRQEARREAKARAKLILRRIKIEEALNAGLQARVEEYQ